MSDAGGGVAYIDTSALLKLAIERLRTQPRGRRAMVGLADAADRRVKGYSTGMRQRLAIAAALLGDLSVLILDKPTNGLDPPGISWIRRILREQAADGRAVLVSSHVLAEVAQSVDDSVVVAHGRSAQPAPSTPSSAATMAPRPRSGPRSPSGSRALRLCALGARDGVRHVTLNATGESACGARWACARSASDRRGGCTARRCARARPRRVVAYVEAIARGDVAALEATAAALEPGEREARLLNGRTPLQQAVESGQPATAAWLVDHGAELDVLMAWLLGWRDRARGTVDRAPRAARPHARG